MSDSLFGENAATPSYRPLQEPGNLRSKCYVTCPRCRDKFIRWMLEPIPLMECDECFKIRFIPLQRRKA